MNLEEIRAEMARKPDPHLLLEWIGEHAQDNDVRTLTEAYFDALEEA